MCTVGDWVTTRPMLWPRSFQHRLKWAGARYGKEAATDPARKATPGLEPGTPSLRGKLDDGNGG
jgi:hypothetical protein